MRQRNTIYRQTIFNLISNFENMTEKGGVFFPDESPYHKLIDYYEGEYLIERAIEVADYAILQFGLAPEFYLRKAELLLEIKQAEVALAILDRVESLVPGCLTTSLLRSEGLVLLDMHQEAILLLDTLKKDASGKELSEIFVREALIYHQQKSYEREFYTLQAALQEDPTSKEALSRMWYSMEYARKYQESVAIHEAILDEHPFCSLAWYNLAAACQYLCEHDRAIEAYEYAFLTNENFEFAYRECAEVCLYTGKYQKALQCYQDVLERFEPDADLFQRIGICYKKLGNFLIARSFFEKALNFNANCDESFFHIGTCFAGQKQWSKAVRFYLKAIQVEDRNEEYFAELAEAYYQMGKYKKAEDFFREAADIAADDPVYWIRLTRFLMEINRLEDAIEVLDDAEEFSYGSELLYYRSACLFKLGRKREALLVLEDALCEDFEAHNALFNLLPVLENDSEVKAVISIFQPE